MNAANYTLWFVVPIVFLAQAVVVAAVVPRGSGRAGPSSWGVDRALAHMSHNPAGIVGLLISWLLVTAAAWWVEFFVGFGAVHVALFIAGRWAAIVVAILFAEAFLATPVVVGKIMLGMAHRGSRETRPAQLAHA